MDFSEVITAKYRDVEDFARGQNLLAEGESFFDAFSRVARVLVDDIEQDFGADPDEVRDFYHQFMLGISEGSIVLGTPILINAGRQGRDLQPLTSCIAPPRNVLRGTLRSDLVASLYDTEMGMAVNLDDIFGNPGEVIDWLDEQARLAEGRGKKRACNMVTMSSNHPDILDFIDVKLNADHSKSKTNISVMVDDRFMEAVEADGDYTLDLRSELNEDVIKTVKARQIFDKIVFAAHKNGDPGIVFKDRIFESDPTPHLSDSIALAPCSELSLTPGEACQFSYINLGTMVSGEYGNKSVDWDKMEQNIHFLLRFLDNALEYSLPRYFSEESRTVNAAKRKVGIGILGLADMFIELGIQYNSPEAVELTRDVMSFINYHSKLASVNLAKDRGHFPAFPDSRYAKDDQFIESRLSRKCDSKITAESWDELASEIKRYGLRNATTIAIPPTGRSSQLIKHSTASVEPIWSCLASVLNENESDLVFDIEMGGVNRKVTLNPRLVEMLNYSGIPIKGELVDKIIESRGAIGSIVDLPDDIRKIFVTTSEIEPAGHIAIVSEIQKHIDEAISKTVNLPTDAPEDIVREVYIRAWKSGLKGITVFRDGCIGEAQQIKIVAKKC